MSCKRSPGQLQEPEICHSCWDKNVTFLPSCDNSPYSCLPRALLLQSLQLHSWCSPSLGISPEPWLPLTWQVLHSPVAFWMQKQNKTPQKLKQGLLQVHMLVSSHLAELCNPLGQAATTYSLALTRNFRYTYICSQLQNFCLLRQLLASCSAVLQGMVSAPEHEASQVQRRAVRWGGGRRNHSCSIPVTLFVRGLWVSCLILEL